MQLGDRELAVKENLYAIKAVEDRNHLAEIPAHRFDIVGAVMKGTLGIRST